MTFEELLIDKLYYKNTFMKEDEFEHPIRVLGEAYLAEQQNELAELSYIRFAQGEVYFHNKDFESAIFKWENIENELEPWAKKNMADAYFELGLYPTAEEIYRSIVSDSPILTTEISIKLFSIYTVQGNMEKAVETIKEAVAYNPDYKDLTDIAREYFEDQEDWANAIELAVNEAIRTDSPKWFEVLIAYSEEGKTNRFAPNYFSKVLVSLYIVNQRLFETFVSSLWKSYRNETRDVYLTWIKEINHILINIEDRRNGNWHELSALFAETYSELLNGQLLLKELSLMIPEHLENWLKIADSTHALAASAAVLSWGEIFPSSINQSIIQEAENIIVHAKNETDVLEESVHLFETILKWAETQEVQISYSLHWMVRKLLDLRVHHVLVAGNTENGKADFINTALGGHGLGTPSASFIMYDDADTIDISEITNTGVSKIDNLEEFHKISMHDETIIDFKLPSDLLNNCAVTLSYMPGNGKKHIYLPDAILAVINPSEYDGDYLFNLSEQMPYTPLHFVINDVEKIYSEQEITILVEEIRSKFPYALVLTSTDTADLTTFIKSITQSINVEEVRTANMLSFIRALMSNILEQRKKMENDLDESIKWEEEMATKLGGAIHQLQDMEKEKVENITQSYQTIKNEIKEELKHSIPALLKGSSELIKENSDFRKIHIELNEEMNNRIQLHVEKQVLPNFYSSIQQWISYAGEEFYQCKTFLDEMREGFNSLYGEERLKLFADEKVLDDWRRDAERMKNGIRIDKVNILLRHTPSQVILKSAGKLFGALQQNKTILYNKYKKFIENEDYQEVVNTITNKFLMQFELFETSIERDIAMFFKNPLLELEETVKKTEATRQNNVKTLNRMKASPEKFRDPLSLFEVKLRQYEWIIDASKESYPVV
ncbi:tetratricopeptide repeat protein [Heyndrickxia sporothermodurans]|uniref:GTP-binding protein n=1 Tax=Heyndrickxia sporothermodurans TaxID=46224 RepID=A0AB37HE87_9BACI|nr:GTP-binding protein [Heyndrickxia sporothermodurans]MBL5771730.1 GTP-binding protein [Heyndrickxia sporothermodurans]MBL5775342.1 GTP-binding protein [Heyndrickxia sporothermodurans]MBL5778831.1 GTP-binding protein [Heyndrickxia sporothermodurans]MBL5781954.1 GTP-binding protein [Heyndrickxia sporothermodurans]MBL5785999.1 GTP-binding protein [Heyndrickxia sporothermodurans]